MIVVNAHFPVGYLLTTFTVVWSAMFASMHTLIDECKLIIAGDFSIVLNKVSTCKSGSLVNGVVIDYNLVCRDMQTLQSV